MVFKMIGIFGVDYIMNVVILLVVIFLMNLGFYGFLCILYM